MADGCDTTFAHAVRSAATGNRKPLDKLLRSGAHLGEGERQMIADLDSGLLRPVGGRSGALTQDQQRRIAARYLASPHKTAEMNDLVRETLMHRSTIYGWVRSLRKGLKNAPDPDLVLRQILDPNGEAERIRVRVEAANLACLDAQSHEDEQDRAD